MPTRGGLVGKRQFKSNKGSLAPLDQSITTSRGATGCFSPIIGQDETRGIISPQASFSPRVENYNDFKKRYKKSI